MDVVEWEGERKRSKERTARSLRRGTSSEPLDGLNIKSLSVRLVK